jgi:hypothetical protein
MTPNTAKPCGGDKALAQIRHSSTLIMPDYCIPAHVQALSDA